MAASIEQMQIYYARRAPIYDASMGYRDPAHLAVLTPVIRAIQRELRGRSVLEVAGGPAFWTRMASTVARAFVASDYNQSMLKEAARKPLSESVALVCADAYLLPFGAAIFDGALAVDWLAHVPRSQLHRFLARLHATMKPGARIVFCDQTAGPRSLTGLFDDEGNHLQVRHLPDGSEFHVIKHFFTDAELGDLLTPFASTVAIEDFPEARRRLVSYEFS